MRVTGVRSLGRGVAYTLASAELGRLHRELVERFGEVLTAQDRQAFRAHVVVQNKVTPEVARDLLRELEGTFAPWEVGAVGVDLWHYLGGAVGAGGAVCVCGGLKRKKQVPFGDDKQERRGLQREGSGRRPVLEGFAGGEAVGGGAGAADEVGEADAEVAVAEQGEVGEFVGEEGEELGHAVEVADGVLGEGAGPAADDVEGGCGDGAEDGAEFAESEVAELLVGLGQ